jgi:UDP-N-acetylmuramate--alanine ligase
VRIDSIERHSWSTRMTAVLPGNVPVVLRLHTPAIHHARNAVAALATLVAVGMDSVDAAEAVSSFIGVRRRFTPIGENGGVTVVDCDADHHNEIKADLEAARAVAGEARVIAVCQPSGYQRVREFARHMGTALADGSDIAVLLPIHGSTPESGVSQTIIGDAVVAAGGTVRFSDQTDVPTLVAAIARPGDVVVLLGTGNVTGLATPLLVRLSNQRSPAMLSSLFGVQKSRL